MKARSAFLLLCLLLFFPSQGIAEKLPPPTPAESPLSPAPLPTAPLPAPNCTPAMLPFPVPAPRPAPQLGEFDVQYLLWWAKPMRTPPLATTSSAGDMGILGAASTRQIYGGDLETSGRTGIRFAGQVLMTERIGLGVGGFYLVSSRDLTPLNNLSVLSLPIIDANTGTPAVISLANPGTSTGSAMIQYGRQMWGVDGNSFYQLTTGPEVKVDLFAGVRYIRLEESLQLATSTTPTGAGLFVGQVTLPGSQITGYDYFSTRNQFYGGQVGFRMQTLLTRELILTTQAQVAFGSTFQEVIIRGTSYLVGGGLGQTAALGNTYSQSTNLGRLSRSELAYAPQVGVGLSYQLSRSVRIQVGYDFLYWSKVTRPGTQIDPIINPTLVPILDNGTHTGPPRPASRIESTDFWTQGLTLGLQVAF